MRYLFLIIVSLSIRIISNATTQFIDNGIIRLGINPQYGGSISYLAYSKAPDTNLINKYDLGREIQMSFYAGPPNFCTPRPAWKDWPWNPISAGDAYGNPSRIIDIHLQSPTILYVKTAPLMWACEKVECECEFEMLISLIGTYVKVDTSLNNHRGDRTAYGKRDQELPAFYTIGKLWQMWTYTGDNPWEREAPSMHIDQGPPWVKYTATESWAAFTMDNTTDNWGLGLVSPGKTQLLTGYSHSNHQGEEYDPTTGYLAFLDQLDITWNSQYKYTFYLVLGNLKTIRETAYHLQGH